MFPKALWAELYEQERIDYHPVFPGKPGFAARRIDTEEDVRDVVELLRLELRPPRGPPRPAGGGLSMQGIVTGASRGLGLALTRELVSRGWQLVVDARDTEPLEHAVAGLEGVVWLAGDVADPDHRRALVAAAGGPIDLLVNNASTLGPTPLPALAEYPLEELRHVYEVNVLAPLALVQLALPRFAAGARVLNVSSDAAVEPYEQWGGYGSSKAALSQLTAILGVENPNCASTPSTPGTCARRCSRTHFRARTSLTGPRPRTACPASSR